MYTLLSDYIFNFRMALSTLDLSQVDRVSDLLLTKRQNQNSIYIAGNGGSAALAEHMSIDLMFGTQTSLPSLKTFCLSSNSASITATGNDVSFESIFSRQIHHLGMKGDLLVVISASGNSINLVNAVNEAKELGMETLGILGFDGGKLLDLVDHAIHVKTSIGAYGISEDLHLMISHLLVENIKGKVAK
jgi:D-sedoheptulose 7-phosphate isomerase